jgi:sulfur relay (sulfurtransferase) complex TusBCD TusD component (DsrE family)
MKALFVLNDPPYGTERCYNGLLLAHALPKNDPAAEVTVFLMADAVIAARKGQKTPDGYYNMERMLKRVATAIGMRLDTAPHCPDFGRLFQKCSLYALIDWNCARLGCILIIDRQIG